jgi:hypothetical protein
MTPPVLPLACGVLLTAVDWVRRGRQRAGTVNELHSGRELIDRMDGSQ